MRGAGIFLAWLAVPFVISGCATQADMIDFQTTLEKSQAEQAEFQNRL